jgi:hypothetical protein
MTAISSIATGQPPIYKSLFLQVVVALVLGVVLGASGARLRNQPQIL